MIAPVTGSRTVYAVLYARFSPRSMSKACPSCDVQLADLREYCARLGYLVRGEFRDDAKSGKSMAGREGLRAALACVKRGDVFLCRDNSRLSRSMFDSLYLVRKLVRRGVTFETLLDGSYSATDPNKFAMFGFKAVMNECQRMTVGLVTSAKMLRHQYSDGRRMGRRDRIPTGYMLDPLDDTKMIPCAAETEAVRLIRELHAAGESAQGIVDCLHGRGLEYRGGPWKRGTVRKILRRELSTA